MLRLFSDLFLNFCVLKLTCNLNNPTYVYKHAFIKWKLVQFGGWEFCSHIINRGVPQYKSLLSSLFSKQFGITNVAGY